MMINFLEQNWYDLTVNLPEQSQLFFQNLIQLYGSAGRHYHQLNHIESLLKLSQSYRHLLSDPKTIDFAIWYHDAIYDARKSDNEEKSAALAKDQLTKLKVDLHMVRNCCDLIMATKKHELPDHLISFDAQFLLDIDLSILAESADRYHEYTQQIRMEYHMYPDLLYKEGRKNVLRHFLAMDQIYKTVLFQDLWEQKARENLIWELGELA